jgi:hypothetical protein
MSSFAAAPWFLLLNLCLMLMSCGTTGHSVTPGPKELVHLMLVIETLPDGGITHSWQPSGGYTPPAHLQYSMATPDFSGSIVRASWTRDCEAENGRCIDECMRSDQTLPAALAGAAP